MVDSVAELDIPVAKGANKPLLNASNLIMR